VELRDPGSSTPQQSAYPRYPKHQPSMSDHRYGWAAQNHSSLGLHTLCSSAKLSPNLHHQDSLIQSGWVSLSLFNMI
jgi:hypothetical protein